MALILRTLWFKSATSISDLDVALRNFIKKSHQQSSDKSVVKFLNRSNLRREIGQDKLTWRGFMRSLRVSDVAQVEIKMTFRYRNKYKQPVDVEQTINLDDFSLADLFGPDGEESDDTQSGGSGEAQKGSDE